MTEAASVSVNGKWAAAEVVPETFVAIQREWKTGDRIELDLLLMKRLESIDPRHAKTVALMRGPLILFAVTDSTSGAKPVVVEPPAVGPGRPD